MNAWQFFVKWAVLIILLLVIAKTDLGRRFVYYGMWLAVLLLIVTHPSDIANVLNPTSSTP